jgi:hypothetical protein
MTRPLLKRLSQALLLLMLAAMLDTCVSAARTHPHLFSWVAPPLETGTFFAENRISNPVQLAYLLRVDPVIPGIDIRFVERNGRIWRAVIQVRPGVEEGEHLIHVLQPGEAPGESSLYRVHVFPDAAARRRASPSYLRRYLGIQPWWVALGLMPVAAMMLAQSWSRSREEERRLRRMGLGVIYKLARRKDCWELIAGLGTADGVRAAELVRLLSSNLAPIATLRVLSAYPDHLTATVGLDVAIKPDCYVARMDLSQSREQG